MGLWMLAFKVNFFDDMRLCNPVCHDAAIAILNSACSGLCDPLHEMSQYHAVNACRADSPSPIPYLPSIAHNKDFELMRV
jgi:hypothetical protein